MMDLDAFWDHFKRVFQCLAPIGHQNGPQGLPDHLMVDPRCQNGIILDIKNDMKSLKTTIFYFQWSMNPLFHEDLMTSDVKKHDFGPAFSGEFPF